MTLGGNGHEEGAGYGARTPEEVEQIQGRASATGIRRGYQQIRRWNGKSQTCSVRSDAKHTQCLRTDQQQGDTGCHQQKSSLDRKSKSPAGSDYTRPTDRDRWRPSTAR